MGIPKGFPEDERFSAAQDEFIAIDLVLIPRRAGDLWILDLATATTDGRGEILEVGYAEGRDRSEAADRAMERYGLEYEDWEDEDGDDGGSTGVREPRKPPPTSQGGHVDLPPTPR